MRKLRITTIRNIAITAASVWALQILAGPFSVAACAAEPSGNPLTSACAVMAAEENKTTAAPSGKTLLPARTAKSVEEDGTAAVSGEKPGEADIPDNAGLWLDLNGDGTTNRQDYALMRSWLQNYTTSLTGREKVTLNGNNEAPDSITQLIRQQVGMTQELSYGMDVDGTARYCINNIGLGTPVQNQNSYGTCWAFAENAAVESAVLRAKTGYSGTEILPQAVLAPQLTENRAENLLSSLYLSTKAYEAQTDGSQKGEGLFVEGNDAQKKYNAGGFLSFVETVYGNWDGPVSEEDEPYEQLTEAGSSGNAQKEGGSLQKDGREELQGHLQDYYYYASPAVTEENPKTQLREWKSYDPAATKALKEAMVRYGALAVMISSDPDTPDASGETERFNYNTWMQYSAEDNVVYDHAVTLVGWDDTIPASMFSDDPDRQPAGDGAWLVKNSWGSYAESAEHYGETWLLETLGRAVPGTKGYYLNQISFNYGIPDEAGRGSGYFWLSYYDKSIAGAAAAADVDIPDDGYEYDHNYTYQYALSLTNGTMVLPAGNDKTQVANLFTVNSPQTLKAVSVEAPAPGVTAEIEIYLLDDDSGTSEQGGLGQKNAAGQQETVCGDAFGEKLQETVPVLTQRVSLAEMGLHTVKLETPVFLQKGQRFAVVERITSFSETLGKRISWLNLETALREDLQTDANYGSARTVVKANEGETYAYVLQGDGSYAWKSPAQLDETESGEVFRYGNALIHAYTCDS